MKQLILSIILLLTRTVAATETILQPETKKTPSQIIEITPGPLLSITDAIEKANARNIDLMTAQMEIEIARGSLKKAWGMLLPVAMAKLDYTLMDHEDRLDLSESINPLLNAMGLPAMDIMEPLLVNPKHNLTGSLQIYVPLINPEGWLTVATAKKGIEVAGTSIETIRRQLLLGTAQAYFLALSCLELIEFYKSQITTATEQLRVAQARFQAGGGMRIDVIRAETDIKQARQSLLKANLAFDNARDTLAHLTQTNGLPMPQRLGVISSPEKLTDEEIEENLHQHNLVKVNSLKIELADKQLKAARMQYLPTLGLSLFGSYQFTQLPDLGSDDRSRWAAMLSLTIPIYNHFRYGTISEKKASLKQAQFSLQSTQDKASLLMRKAQRDYDAAIAQVEIAQKQLNLATEGLRLVEAAYQAGAQDSLSVTNARQTLIAAGFNLTSLELVAQLALLDLLDALNWDLMSNLPQ